MNERTDESTAPQGKARLNEPAPDFTLPDQNGTLFHLKDHLGAKSLVLFFYPRDNTPGCTTESCAFRDSYQVFQDAGADVIGISADSVDSHRDFAASHRLPYTLLSDEKDVVRKAFGVPKTLGILPGRVTYVLDPQGIVRHIFSSQMNPEAHIVEALKVLKTF